MRHIHVLQGYPGRRAGASASDDRLKYFWQVHSLGDLSRFEIHRPTGQGSFPGRLPEGREGGVHHITLQTQDISRARRMLVGPRDRLFRHMEYGDLWKELLHTPEGRFGVLVQIAEFTRTTGWTPRWDAGDGQGRCRIDAGGSQARDQAPGRRHGSGPAGRDEDLFAS
jgi:hypothetical protein